MGFYIFCEFAASGDFLARFSVCTPTPMAAHVSGQMCTAMHCVTAIPLVFLEEKIQEPIIHVHA